MKNILQQNLKAMYDETLIIHTEHLLKGPPTYQVIKFIHVEFYVGYQT